MSFCSNCGKELMDGAAFCEECGTPVEQSRGAAAIAYGNGLSSVQNMPFHIIGGVAFVLIALFDMFWAFRYGIIIKYFLYLLLDIAFAVSLFARIKMPVIQIAMGLEVVVKIGSIISELSYGAYNILSSSSFYWSYGMVDEKFNFFCLLPEILIVFAYIAACAITVIIGMEVLKEYKPLAEKLWFVPAALLGASMFLNILVELLFNKIHIFGIYRSLIWYSFSSALIDVLLLVGITAAILFLKNGEASEFNWTTSPSAGTSAGVTYTTSANTNGSNTAGVQYSVQTSNIPAGFCSLVMHGLLLLFTFGIWQFIWVYKTTQFLNCVQDEPPRNPTTKLLLCIFVPFYIIYWVYKHAKYIDRLAAMKGIPSDLATLCLVMMFLLPIVSLVLMQDKINSIVMSKK